MNFKLETSPIFAAIVFHACIIKPNYIASYNLYAALLCFVALAYILLRANQIFKGAYLRFNVLLICMSFFMLISSLVNNQNLDGTFLYIARINILAWFIESQFIEGRIRQCAAVFFILSFAYLLITYWYIATDPLLALSKGMNYFVGTKFSVSYLAMFALIMFVLALNDHQHNRLFIRALFICMVCASYYLVSQVKCTTGLVALTIFLVIALMGKRLYEKLKKPRTIIITTVLSSIVLLLFGEVITHFDAVSNILTNVLNKGLSISGRTIVYERALDYIADRFFLGYGYNSVYSLFHGVMEIGSNVYAADAQNALLEYWFYFGFIGIILLLALIRLSFLRVDNCDFVSIGRTRQRFIVAGVYSLTLIGMVEVTINIFFFTYLIILYASCGQTASSETIKDKELVIKERRVDRESLNEKTRLYRRRGLWV